MILLAVFLIVTSGALEVQRDTNTNVKILIDWSYKKDLPAPRIQGCAVVCGSDIYYIGGRDSRRQKQNSVFKYDLKNNTWTTCAPIPTPRWNFSIAACQGKIYTIGGWDELYKATSDVLEGKCETQK